MDYYNYKLIIKMKQQEIERLSKDAWRYSHVRQESLLSRLVKKFTAKKKAHNQKQRVCLCKC
ncbi:hypothetical protein [Cytobacillus sp. NCCP-133]|uniref:hypothetical protein n=1 Tax=Cytobacillus sp. NCCP-133 TaxID=766848 RepID=UPI002231AE33|nr:hypothetical protein [Cytobacillus sp. NCCP-133]GLB59622.1 hypothetical protein NCCP133_17550 [Cytobacillus sp. NCCP-133]